MKRLMLVAGVAGLASMVSFAAAQSSGAEAEIDRAVLAAPPALRADAMVVRFADDGTHQVLRPGTNGLACYDRSNRAGRNFSVQCTSEGNLPRVAQTHQVQTAAANGDEVSSMLAKHEAEGTRVNPEFGSVWYSLNGSDASSANPHITIAVPFATSDTLGLPSEGNYRAAGTWIMEAGTSGAHIMVPGR